MTTDYRLVLSCTVLMYHYWTLILVRIITALSGVIMHLRVQWLISLLTKILLNSFKSSSNTVKYYFYGPYPDSATIFDISVKMKCKQTNHRFLTNFATSGGIAQMVLYIIPLK